MTTSTAPTRIRDFVAAVATHFDDLPEEDRRELLDDLEQHLIEISAEDEATLDDELISPERYAAELRRSAGLPERPDARRGRLHRTLDAATVRLTTTAGRLRERPAVASALSFLPQLRPAWWVARAWLLVTLLAMTLGGGPWWWHVPVPGSNLLGLLAVAGAVAFSVHRGREDRDGSWPWRAGDAVAAVVAVALAFQALTASPTVPYVEVVHDPVWEPTVLRHPDGEPITNLYLFDLEGRPLTDVLVYDGAGRPVEIGDLAGAGFDHIETDYRRDRFGAPVRHLYPHEQFVVEYDDTGGTALRPRPVPTIDDPALRPERTDQPPGDDPTPTRGTTAEPSDGGSPQPTEPTSGSPAAEEPGPTPSPAGTGTATDSG